MTMVRRLRPVLAVAVAALALAPLAGALAGGAPTGDDLAACKSQVTIQDGWARIASPTYGSGEGENVITSSAAPARTNGWVFVTNGRVVQMSINGGCKWNHVYPVAADQPPVDATGSVIGELVTPSATGLWLTSYDTTGGVARPHVLHTTDATPVPGNRTKVPLTALDDGLPKVGTPVRLAVSPINDRRAYLLVDEPVDPDAGNVATTRHLYRLEVDTTLALAGSTSLVWKEMALPSGFGSPAGLVVSPQQSSSIWVWSGRKYAKSADGGEHWTAATSPGTVTTVDVNESNEAIVFSKLPDGGVAQVMTEPGRPTRSATPPVSPVVAAGHGFRSGVYAASGPRGTYGYDVRAQRWIDLRPPGRPAFSRLHFGSTRLGRILLGQTEDALYRLDLYRNESFVKPPLRERYYDVDWDTGGGLKRPVITPEHQVVTVRPGELADAPFDFGVPASAASLDVFFLVDTTQSMANAITGLKEGVKKIAREVRDRTHGESCFGVGDVKDLSALGRTLAPYRLVQPITCDIGLASKGVDALKEGGGDNDPAEAQTLALSQAVTGTGSPQMNVLPGQDAQFRAVDKYGRVPTRVIVLISDAGFKQGNGFPTIDQAVQDLTAHQTKVVSVMVHTDNNPGPALTDMAEVSEATGTMAPPNGADCDGDKRVDVEPGQPMICETDNDAPPIAPAIVGLLLGVNVPGTIATDILDEHHVVTALTGANTAIDGDLANGRTDRLASNANLILENHLAGALTVTCSAAQDGLDLPVRLVGTVRGDYAAEGEVLVRCRAPKIAPPPPKKPPVPPPPPELPEPPRRPALLPAVVLPVPPPPINNPPPNMNMNAGFSQQEEQQMQIATVGQDAAEQEDESEEVELAMSAVHRDDAAARTMLGCALGMSAVAAAGFAQRRRTQRSVRPAYARLRG
jgi:hypothetical protein